MVHWRQTLPLSPGWSGHIPRMPPPAPVHCPVPAWVGLSSLHSPPYPPSLLFLSLIPAFSTSFTSKRISINWGAHCSGWAALVISSSTIVYRIFGGFVSNIHRNKVQKIKLCWQGHKGSGHGQKGNIRMLQHTSIFQNTCRYL